MSNNESTNRHLTCKTKIYYRQKRTITIVRDSIFQNIYGPTYSDLITQSQALKSKSVKSDLISTTEFEPKVIVIILCGTINLRRDLELYKIRKNEVAISVILPCTNRYSKGGKMTS